MKRKNLPLAEEIISVASKSVESATESTIFIPTGCTLLDLILGGGYPVGKIVNIVGDKSSGKTLLAAEAIAKARAMYGDRLKWIYDDAEAGFSFNTKQLYGFEITKEGQCSTTIEDFMLRLKSACMDSKDDELLVYVLDSLDSLTSEAELKRQKKRERALEKGEEADVGTYGLEKQKMLSELFRLLRRDIKDKNCLLIIISQVRSNIGVMFGEKYIRTGGKALDFYASQILWLAEAEKHYKEGRVVGVTIKAKAKKNKISRPFREGFLELLFDYGIDDIATNIQYLYDLKTPAGKTKSEKLNWDGKPFIMRGLVKHIEKNSFETELRKRVAEKWNQVEDSISSKERKKKYE